MLHLNSKKSLLSIVSLCAGLITIVELHGYVSSLDKFDPFPVFSARDPQGFLLDRKKLNAEGTDWWHWVGDHCEISVNGFFQSANSGKPFDGGDILAVSVINDTVSTANSIGYQWVPLLDLTGRTPMLPLFMSTNGAAPANATYGPLLNQAVDKLLSDAAAPNTYTAAPTNNIDSIIDPHENFAFFSFPSKYQLRGIRGEVLIGLFSCVGMHLRGGFGSVSHAPRPPIDETCNELTCPFTLPIEGFPSVTKPNVETYLMNEYDCIMKEIGMSNKEYQKTGIEELMVELYWRYPFSLNQNREDWLQVLAIPYIEGGFAYSPSDAVNTSELYGHMLGNNKHWAAGLTAGFCLDFVETVEIGGEVGYTQFFAENFDCYRLPNSKLQNNIFPFMTSVNVQPGHNMHYALKLTARNFLEKLSGYFQFVALEHSEDCISLLHQDPAFVPEALGRKTGFKVKVANIGITYPITPNFIAGFMWQAPLSQRNAARTTTIMFGLTGSF